MAATTSKKLPEFACTLTPDELRERRSFVRKNILKYINSWELLEQELTLYFSELALVRPQLEEFVALERQCCGFLSFEILATQQPLRLRITGPDGSGEDLKMFTDTVSDCRA